MDTEALVKFGEMMSDFRIIRRGRWYLHVAMYLSILVVLLSACVREGDLTLEQQAYLLDSQLMCPVCDGQTLDQSQAQISRDMRQIIREKLAEGETTREIRDFFVIRYGENVLAAPDATGLNTVAWVMPAVIGVFGLAAVGFAFRNMKSKDGEPSASFGQSEGRISKYLQIVEEDTHTLIENRTDSRPVTTLDDEEESV